MKGGDLLLGSCCLLLNIFFGATFEAPDDVIKAVTCPVVCSCQLDNDVSSTSSLEKAVTASVDCSDSDLLEIPEGIPMETRTLDLRGNLLTDINPQTLFGRYDNLLEVDFSYNSITRLDHIAEFLNWSRITALDFECNSIGDLPCEIFKRPSDLKYLTFSNNKLVSLGEGCFVGLQELRSLALRRNQIYSLAADAFKGLFSLETLLLDSNLLTTITDSVFKSLSSLVNISLSLNEIEIVDDRSFHGLTKLQRVDLSHNLLKTTLTRTVSAMDCLRELILDGNGILILNRRSFYRSSMRDVSLSNMPLLAIIDEEAFYDLSQLEILRLNGNSNLSYIHPRAFFQVENLRILYLDNNNLIAIQGQLIASLPVLEAISLSENPLHCDCNVRWIRETMENGDGQNMALSKSNMTIGSPFANLILQDAEKISCESPVRKSLRVTSVTDFDEECQPMTIPFFVGTTLAEVTKSVTLNCRAIGNPPPTIHWILPNRSTVNGTTNSNRIHFHPSGTITVASLKPTDHGTYTCWASNSRGHDASSTYLHIYSISVNLQLTHIGSSFVSISWNGTDPTVTSAGYVIQYRQCNQPDQGGCGTYGRVDLRPDMKGFTVTNLEPRSNYEFCICSENPDRKELGVKINCIQVETKDDLFSFSAIQSFLGSELALVILAAALVLLISCPALVYIQRQKRRSSYLLPEISVPDIGQGETGPVVESTATGATSLAPGHSSSVLSNIPLRCLLERTILYASSSKHANSRTSLLEPC